MTSRFSISFNLWTRMAMSPIYQSTDAKEHNRGFIRRDANPFFPQEVQKKCDGGSHFRDNLERAPDIIRRRRMVIVNMDIQTGFHHDLRKFPDPADLTGVDQDQSFDLAEVNIFQPFHLAVI